MSTLDLINAIANGDAVATEQAFNSAMAEKVSGHLDAMRADIAQSMFTAKEEVAEPAATVEDEQGE